MADAQDSETRSAAEARTVRYNAIRAYERANRLRVDGRIDGELLRSLGIS